MKRWSSSTKTPPRRTRRSALTALTGMVAVFVLALLLTSFCPHEAVADPWLDVGKGDVNVQAEKLEVDVATGSAILTGQVLLQKGELVVHCPRIELKFDTSPHLHWAKGSGGVVADVRGVHGEAPEVELDLKSQVFELRGGVKLSRGQAWIQADKATIELATARVTATQVKGTIPVPTKPKP